MHEPTGVCLITGANSGIGKATALQLARQGAQVVMVCRDPRRGQAAQQQIMRASGNAAVDLLIADLASQRAVRQLASEVQSRYARLSVLINNAGVMLTRRSVTEDGIERTFAVNHLAYYLLANLLLALLEASAPARIVNVASGAAFSGTLAFDDLMGEQYYTRRRAYEQSKLANVLFTVELARRCAGRGVTVNCVNPGTVLTNLGGMGRRAWLTARRILAPAARKALNLQPVERAAAAIAYLATASEVEGVSGQYFEGTQAQALPPEMVDAAICRRLWQVSAQLTGVDTSYS